MAGVICISTDKSHNPNLNLKPNCRKTQKWHFYEVETSKKKKAYGNNNLKKCMQMSNKLSRTVISGLKKGAWEGSCLICQAK